MMPACCFCTQVLLWVHELSGALGPVGVAAPQPASRTEGALNPVLQQLMSFCSVTQRSVCLYALLLTYHACWQISRASGACIKCKTLVKRV